MTKDDELLRETVLAELKRRRGLSGESKERVGGETCDRRSVRPGLRVADNWAANSGHAEAERHSVLPAGTTGE